jgi:hypothetical protein
LYLSDVGVGRLSTARNPTFVTRGTGPLP